jgi:sugar phosphate isomerase/epimerase
MAKPIAVHMVSVWGDADRDLSGTLERIAEMGYLGIELVGLHGATPDEFRAKVDALDLEVIGGSLPFLDDEKELEKYYNATRDVGCKLVMTHLEEKHFASPESVAKAADLCNRFAATIQPEGMELVYHNHWWECTPRGDGTLPLVEFASQLDESISLVPDVYWVAVGGVDVADTLRELGGRVKRLHLKDGPINETDPMTAVGSGKVDIPAAVAAAPQADWHVAELDTYDGDPLEAIAQSYDYLTGNGLSRGRDRQ